MADDDEIYPCVGVCMADPESGVCLGCGRPPLGSPDVHVELVSSERVERPPAGDPDSAS